MMLKTLFCCLVLLIFVSAFGEVLKRNKSELIKKLLLRRKRIEGALRLVGGRVDNEGNIEVMHKGKWGSVCDDEWDLRDADVVCRQLKFPSALKPTHSSLYGKSKNEFWMDNVYCDGTETRLDKCRFDGWGASDCTDEEAAGVVCRVPNEPEELKDDIRESSTLSKKKQSTNMMKVSDLLKPDFQIRLTGGRVPEEGKVEIRNNGSKWVTICGDGWSLLEANVVCKQLGLGYALAAPQGHFNNDVVTIFGLSGLECRGNETNIRDCKADNRISCPGQGNVAGVLCTKHMADLLIDSAEIVRSAYLEDRQLYFLQCAMEENCLASSAYRRQIELPEAWHLEVRRLLRFTARVTNIGSASFRPALPKHLWQFHQCHMHYHSMEVFATFDVISLEGKVIAEGHKASFCLEDNECSVHSNGASFACANYGDQGVSVNCSDVYKHNIDCQWVDVTDLPVGQYIFKVAINPEFKVAEQNFENNAAVCEMVYTETYAKIYNCKITKP